MCFIDNNEIEMPGAELRSALLLPVDQVHHGGNKHSTLAGALGHQIDRRGIRQVRLERADSLSHQRNAIREENTRFLILPNFAVAPRSPLAGRCRYIVAPIGFWTRSSTARAGRALPNTGSFERSPPPGSAWIRCFQAMLSAGGQLKRKAICRGIQRCLLREQCIDEEFRRPIWILQRGIAAVDGQRAFDAAVVRLPRRRHVLRHDNIIE